MGDPYLTFRWVLAILLAGTLLYDLIELGLWYRELPKLARRVVLLKLLQVRSRALKVELSLIVLLFAIQGWLTILLLRG
ncbi:MAG TPA: hypothetical protein VFA47_10260 [Candidatus Manganitrophaceae bacterium]|nr:hypothetical protein [Candidatus Manganitrophaceae bacterium]